MEFEEIKSLRKTFDKYLNYNGINLWELSEWLMYPLLTKTKKRNQVQRLKENVLKELVRLNNLKQNIMKNNHNGEEKKIIIIVSSPIHVRTFKTIIKKRNDLKVIKQDPPFSNVTKKNLDRNKILYSNFDSYFDESIKNKMKSAEKWLDQQWLRIKKDENLKKNLGKNYEQVLNALEYFLETRKKYLEIIRFIELLNKIYDTEKNKLVILAEELNPLARAAIIIAKERKIPTLVVQHGSVLGDKFFKEIIAEKTIVSGKREKDFLISHRVNKRKIEVFGNPRFDDIKEKGNIPKEEACRRLGLNPKKKIIVFAAQYLLPGDQTIKNAIKEFLETIKEIKDKDNFEFIIKLRPGGGEYLPKIDKKLNIKKVENVDLHLLLRCCDILITASSMVGLEAVLLNRPVITIEIGGKRSLTNYEKDGVGISVYKKGQLIEGINKVLYNPSFKKKFVKNRRKFIEDFAYKLDGKTTERTLNLIDKMVD